MELALQLVWCQLVLVLVCGWVYRVKVRPTHAEADVVVQGFGFVPCAVGVIGCSADRITRTSGLRV